ncbi:unnamed protein product [Moneuplotes crassus]|uniref:Uncharacterized protein n=1 Tax=Euplotes crassus TaxID=5936 RepID=A0AAD1X8T5_EUPCR|nr:unnamed protein product [Moneuplotes crassus]
MDKYFDNEIIIEEGNSEHAQDDEQVSVEKTLEGLRTCGEGSNSIESNRCSDHTPSASTSKARANSKRKRSSISKNTIEGSYYSRNSSQNQSLPAGKSLGKQIMKRKLSKKSLKGSSNTVMSLSKMQKRRSSLNFKPSLGPFAGLGVLSYKKGVPPMHNYLKAKNNAKKFVNHHIEGLENKRNTQKKLERGMKKTLGASQISSLYVKHANRETRRCFHHWKDLFQQEQIIENMFRFYSNRVANTFNNAPEIPLEEYSEKRKQIAYQNAVENKCSQLKKVIEERQKSIVSTQTQLEKSKEQAHLLDTYLKKQNMNLRINLLVKSMKDAFLRPKKEGLNALQKYNKEVKFHTLVKLSNIMNKRIILNEKFIRYTYFHRWKNISFDDYEFTIEGFIQSQLKATVPHTISLVKVKDKNLDYQRRLQEEKERIEREQRQQERDINRKKKQKAEKIKNLCYSMLTEALQNRDQG